jgi:hypothetical protein
MRVSYGFEDYQVNQHLIHQADTVNHDFMVYSKPGALLVGVLPILRHIPSWFPGAGWKGALQELALRSDKMNREPFDKAKSLLVRSHFMFPLMSSEYSSRATEFRTLAFRVIKA